MGGGPCGQVPRWRAWREKGGCQVRPEGLLKEDLELLEGISSEVLF
jgi:hypothetical protein